MYWVERVARYENACPLRFVPGLLAANVYTDSERLGRVGVLHPPSMQHCKRVYSTPSSSDKMNRKI